jgi:hypothetical protein
MFIVIVLINWFLPTGLLICVIILSPLSTSKSISTPELTPQARQEY